MQPCRPAFCEPCHGASRHQRCGRPAACGPLPHPAERAEVSRTGPHPSRRPRSPAAGRAAQSRSAASGWRRSLNPAWYPWRGSDRYRRHRSVSRDTVLRSKRGWPAFGRRRRHTRRPSQRVSRRLFLVSQVPACPGCCARVRNRLRCAADSSRREGRLVRRARFPAGSARATAA